MPDGRLQRREGGLREADRKSIPGLDEMSSGKYTAQQDADAANNHVGDAEEGVAAAHDGAGADEHGFCTLELGDGEVYLGLAGV
jgi:hypothetical protein